MNLIDRYVTEVGKHLPRKNRVDIEAELRSTLEDMLEDRSKQTGRQADEALAAELLQEYGSPRVIARSYQTHAYLIGPKLFPTFTLVLRIVLFAVTLGLTIATVVSLISGDMTSPQLLETLGEFVSSLITGLAGAFGYVTLIFAILERVLPEPDFELEEAWTPDELSSEPEPGRVKLGERITSIVFIAAALIILNFYPQMIGIWNNVDGAWTQIAGLSDAFSRYLPWINLSGALIIALDLWLLRQETWNLLTRGLHIGLEIIGIAIAAAMLRGPSLLTFYPSDIGLEAGTALTRVFTFLVPAILIIVIVVSAIEIVKDILKLLNSAKGLRIARTG